MQSNSVMQSQLSSQNTLIANPVVNPSSRPAIASLPPETFQYIPHVQPQRFISGWIWTLFVGSLVSVLGAVAFTSLTRTGSVLEWSVPTIVRQGEVNRD